MQVDSQTAQMLSARSVNTIGMRVVGALPTLCMVFVLYLLVHSITEAVRIIAAGGSLMCSLTNISFFCPMTNSLAHFQSGASLQISHQKLNELASQIDLNAKFSAVKTLPAQLHLQANWINDNVNSLIADASLTNDKVQMKALVSECATWSRNLHITARRVRGLQLTIRSFASRVVEVLPLVLDAWKNGKGTIASMRAGFASLKVESQKLIDVLRETDEALDGEREHASQFVARIMDKIALTQDEIISHAESWSWGTTVAVYGAAATVGVMTGGTMTAPAALALTSIAHLAQKTSDQTRVRALESQRIQSETAAVVVKNTRALLLDTADQMQSIQFEMSQSEDGLNEIAIIVASENGLVAIPRAYTALALPGGGSQSDTAQQLEVSISELIKTYQRILRTVEDAIESRPFALPSSTVEWAADKAQRSSTTTTQTPTSKPRMLPLPTQLPPEPENEMDMKQSPTESLFGSILQKLPGTR